MLRRKWWKKRDNGKTTTYKLKFIDSLRFISTLSDLIDNQEFTKKNAKHAWKEKILNQNAILLGLEIIN